MVAPLHPLISYALRLNDQSRLHAVRFKIDLEHATISDLTAAVLKQAGPLLAGVSEMQLGVYRRGTQDTSQSARLPAEDTLKQYLTQSGDNRFVVAPLSDAATTAAPGQSQFPHSYY